MSNIFTDMYIIILHVNYHPRPIIKSTYVMKVIVVNCNVSDKGNTAAYTKQQLSWFVMFNGKPTCMYTWIVLENKSTFLDHLKYLFPTWGYSISNNFDLYSQVEKKKIHRWPLCSGVRWWGLNEILPALQRYTLKYIIHVYITCTLSPHVYIQ